MISVGVDISKDKITVCALEQGSKIIWKPFDVYLIKSKVEELLKDLPFSCRETMDFLKSSS